MRPGGAALLQHGTSHWICVHPTRGFTAGFTGSRCAAHLQYQQEHHHCHPTRHLLRCVVPPQDGVACACPIRRPACDHSSAGPAGFGTILATAFIHMQLPAVESLSNSCLPAFWTETYEAWPFLFCTTAVMCMQSLDFLIKVCARFPGLVTHNEFTNWQPALRCASIPSKLSAAASQLICPAPWLQGFLRRQGTGLEMIESGHAGDSPMHGCHTAVIGAMLSIQPPATQHPSQPHDAEAGEFTESGGGGSCLHFHST